MKARTISALVVSLLAPQIGMAGPTLRIIEGGHQKVAQEQLRTIFSKIGRAQAKDGGEFKLTLTETTRGDWSAREVIEYKPPQGTSAKPFQLELPERGRTSVGEREIKLQVSDFNGDLLVRDGQIGQGNGGLVTWSQSGELKMAHYRFGTEDLGEVFYSINKRDSAYEIQYAKAGANGKTDGFTARIQVDAGEVISSIRDIDPARQSVRIFGTRNGQEFNRVVSFAKPAEPRFPLNNPSGRLPPVEGIQ